MECYSMARSRSARAKHAQVEEERVRNNVLFSLTRLLPTSLSFLSYTVLSHGLLERAYI
jgi:hypothetical protein